jgi:hypothetical protein
LIWLFTAFYSFEPAQLVFAAIAGWAFLRISRNGEHSTKTPKAARKLTASGQLGKYALHDIYQ